MVIKTMEHLRAEVQDVLAQVELTLLDSLNEMDLEKLPGRVPLELINAQRGLKEASSLLSAAIVQEKVNA